MDFRSRGNLAITGFIFSLASFGSSALASTASKSDPWFKSGREKFLMKDVSGKPMQLTMLDKDSTARALALATEAALNAQDDFNPKLPVQDHLEVRVESIAFAPANGDDLKMTAKISGHEVELPKPVSRRAFLSGDEIIVSFPAEDRTALLFDVHFTGGKIAFRLDTAKRELVLKEATGKINYESPLGSEGSEAVRLSGRGARVN